MGYLKHFKNCQATKNPLETI